MNSILLRDVRAVFQNRSDDNANVLVSGSSISEISTDDIDASRVIDLDGATMFPGFIDIHNHGAVGIDVNTSDADGLREIGAFLARNGVTAWLPTFVPDSAETYARVIGEIEKVIAGQDDLPIAQIVGVHYEGIFANTQMCGALRPEYFKTFSGDEVIGLPTMSAGTHMTTFAPEIVGGVELVRELRRRGWIPSIGHTKATPEILDEAFAAGATHMTHFFNAMTGLHHRDVGVVGWGLTRDVSVDIIADGIHVHPELLKFVFDSKGADRVSLISDSVAPTGLGDGEFDLWGETISVKNGRTKNERGSIAGSVITMLDAVRMARSVGVSDVAAAKMASTNPAKLLGIDASRGSIEAGKRADLVAVDQSGKIKMVMIAGKVVDLS
ncbi:MAG: N-acetylglucosamine-6-phosphate deacetylase [Acidobacteria bacterium]|nr:N-acetylglucosamine-6-phosphate deacetylase [Acidobacteriota bacterium]